jgi:hypothetical protein
MAITARTEVSESHRVLAVLPASARKLFLRQSPLDQKHALAVALSLRRAGHTARALQTAALLHDVGKATGRLSPWHRALCVVLDAVAPSLLARLGRPASGPLPHWRRPFVVHIEHARIGARWAAEAGCSPLAVALIYEHHRVAASAGQGGDGTFERLLAALQEADCAN